MPGQGLDRRQSFVLIQEIDESVALANSGLRILGQLRYVVEDQAAVVTLMSIAAEKLLKISLGLAALEAGDPWPSRKAMQTYGHRVVTMNERVFAIYRRNMARATSPTYINRLLTQCDSDPLLDRFLALLDRWGDQGRFYRLDDLAGSAQITKSVSELWDELESHVIDLHPGVLDLIASVDGYDEGRRQINERLRMSYMRWWSSHARAWMHGVLGPYAKQLSIALTRVPFSSA